MNKVILMGRLTRNPDVRYSQGNGESLAIARYTLAVERRGRKNGGDNQQTADFISCIAFGKAAEFTEKYLRQGTKICIRGRIQTGSYTNKEGQKVYTTEVVVEEQEFAESKGAAKTADTSASDEIAGSYNAPPEADDDDYISIPDGIENDLPFK